MVFLETKVVSNKDRDLLEHTLYTLTKLYWVETDAPLPIRNRRRIRAERAERASMINQRITKLLHSMYPGVKELYWECTAVNSKIAHPNCRGTWVFQYDITVDRAYVVQHALRKLDFTAMHEYGIRTMVANELSQFKFGSPTGVPREPKVTGAQAIHDGIQDRIDPRVIRDMHS